MLAFIKNNEKINSFRCTNKIFDDCKTYIQALKIQLRIKDKRYLGKISKIKKMEPYDLIYKQFFKLGDPLFLEF